MIRQAPAAANGRSGDAPRLVVVGPLPPPYHGASVSTGLLVSSNVLKQRFALEHLDTSDRRDGRDNIGRWDIQNVTGGLSGALRLFLRLRGRRGVVYISIAQNVPGSCATRCTSTSRRCAAGASPCICAAVTSATSIASNRP